MLGASAQRTAGTGDAPVPPPRALHPRHTARFACRPLAQVCVAIGKKGEWPSCTDNSLPPLQHPPALSCNRCCALAA